MSDAPAITDEQLWAELDAASPSLEARGKGTVATHLLWAGHDLKRARAVVDGDEVVAGWLHTPDIELDLIGFTPHEEVDPPPRGASVRVVYGRGDDGYVFESELMDEDDGTWLLELPSAIGARGQRLTGRTLANGAWFLRLDDKDQTEIELHDLSVGGVGLLVAPGERPRDPGTVLPGWLFRVDGFVIRATATVRHTSPLADHPDWQVTGCAIDVPDGEEQDALGALLAE